MLGENAKRIVNEDGKHFLAFEPNGYPYGGISSMIGFLGCFGHSVRGYDDGTGYVLYTPREIWKSRRGRSDTSIAKSLRSE